MTMNERWHRARWRPQLDWSTPGAELLRQAAEVLSVALGSRSLQLVVFGSSPLQMGVSEAIMSGDLDIASDEEIEGLLAAACLTKGLSSPYVEVCPLGTFRTALDWRTRAYAEQLGNLEVLFPHPIDILVSKISRGEEKDFEAFEEVIARTGHPAEEELKDSLIRAVHLYKPRYDESAPGGIRSPIPDCFGNVFLEGISMSVRKSLPPPLLPIGKDSPLVVALQDYDLSVEKKGRHLVSAL